jgi:hypothetical protein
MYCPGFKVRMEMILELNNPCFLSSSIRSLLEATNAISIPEKKADISNARIMMVSELIDRTGVVKD